MKENRMEKILLCIAKITCESTSCIGLYEPKVPEKLLTETKGTVNPCLETLQKI